MNRATAIRRLLNEAPSTTAELAALLEVPRRILQDSITTLRTQRQVRGVGRYNKLYELTPCGRAALKRDGTGECAEAQGR